MIDAQTFGGIGVSIMVFKHELEREINAIGKLLNSDILQKRAPADFAKSVIERISVRVAKELQNNKLTKANTSPAAIGKMVGALVADEIMTELHFPEIEERLRKAHASLPNFEAFINNRPFPATQATKGPIRDFGRFAVANKASAELTDLPMVAKKQPILDLDAGAVDAHLRHRPFQRD
jgi:hypothetical protein